MPRKNSNTEGWVYAISDPTRPGLLKIGYTDRDPEQRAAELSGTHAPLPLIVEYQIRVTAALDAERDVHRLLDKEGRRLGKEWFSCDVDTAIRVINQICGKEAVEKKRKAQEEARLADEARQREIARIREENLAKLAEKEALHEASRRAYLELPWYRKMAWVNRHRWNWHAIYDRILLAWILIVVFALGNIAYADVMGGIMALSLIFMAATARRTSVPLWVASLFVGAIGLRVAWHNLSSAIQ